MNRIELDYLLKRFRAIPCSAQAIAEKTGLTQEWVAKLRQGKITEPGVLKICIIQRFVHQYEEDRDHDRQRADDHGGV